MTEATAQGHNTLSGQVFDRLRGDILSAKLRPGTKLNIERMREAYGVGATPLREALSRLSSMERVVAEGQAALPRGRRSAWRFRVLRRGVP